MRWPSDAIAARISASIRASSAGRAGRREPARRARAARPAPHASGARRGRGVLRAGHHDPPAEGAAPRAVADHQRVARRHEQRAPAPQPQRSRRQAPDHPRRGGARPVVDVDLEREVRVERSGATSTVNAASSAPGVARASPRATAVRGTRARLIATRWPASACSTSWPWTCRPRTRTSRASGYTVRRSPGATCAGDQRPGDDGAGAGDREAAVDVQDAGLARSRRPSPEPSRHRIKRATHECPARPPAPAGTPPPVRRGAVPAPGPRPPAAGDARSVLVMATRPVVIPSAPQDLGVLHRLLADSLGGGNDHQEGVDAGGAGHHGADEALVAGDVDQRHRPPRGQRDRREAQLDREPARLLLGQAIGVGPGQRGNQSRLAVVDVARGADGERRCASAPPGICHAPRGHRDLVLVQRPRAEQHPVVLHPRDQRWSAAAQPGGQRVGTLGPRLAARRPGPAARAAAAPRRRRRRASPRPCPR